jgi:hypothetical protein
MRLQAAVWLYTKVASFGTQWMIGIIKTKKAISFEMAFAF